MIHDESNDVHFAVRQVIAVEKERERERARQVTAVEKETDRQTEKSRKYEYSMMLLADC